MRVLELGNYIIPAYAGMVLSEQGIYVEKWVKERRSDPIFMLDWGSDIWDWLNEHKTVVQRSVEYVEKYLPAFDVVIENFLPETLSKLNINPQYLAEKHDVHWVSLRSEVPGPSFDIIAQARSTLSHSPYIPFYIGDTSVGLWLAFKALALRGKEAGHYVLYHASSLAKLVEGELRLPFGKRSKTQSAWDDPGTYVYDPDREEVRVVYKGETYVEPIRSTAWKHEFLNHIKGRIII